MTTTAPSITPWYLRPTPWPFDFIGTAHHVEKLVIFEKQEGVKMPAISAGYGGCASIGYAVPAYFIFMMTPFGDLRIEVSQKVFNVLEVDDQIVVSYRRGRWSGALKGKVAR
jgi:hypothetical protein